MTLLLCRWTMVLREVNDVLPITIEALLNKLKAVDGDFGLNPLYNNFVEVFCIGFAESVVSAQLIFDFFQE